MQENHTETELISNEAPRVLIVIPTYNGSKFVSSTIQSCLDQSYKNIEIVVIDDCSIDDTVESIKIFHDSIKVITSDVHMGLPKNLNRVILNSNSKYFIALGQDDLLERNHVIEMIKSFENDVVAVHCNLQKIDKDGKYISIFYDDKSQMYRTKNLLRELSLRNFISIVGMMHRTSAFKLISGCDESYDLYWEWLYYIKISTLGRIKYNENLKPKWRIHDTNASLTLYGLNRNWSFLVYKTRCRFLAYTKLYDLFHIPRFLIYFINDIRNHIIKIIRLFIKYLFTK